MDLGLIVALFLSGLSAGILLGIALRGFPGNGDGGSN